MVLDRKISFVAFWFEGLDTEKKVADSLATLSKLGYTGVDWKNTCFDPNQDMAMQLKRAKHIADDMGMATCSAVILGNMLNETGFGHTVIFLNEVVFSLDRQAGVGSVALGIQDFVHHDNGVALRHQLKQFFVLV